EIQSDWHQAGRDQGYATPDMYQRFNELQQTRDRLLGVEERLTKTIDATGVDRSEWLPLVQRFTNVAQTNTVERFSTYVDQNYHFNLLHPDVQNDLLEIVETNVRLREVAYESRELQKRIQVPDAPFKKTWHEFVFKKMLLKAVQNGH